MDSAFTDPAVEAYLAALQKPADETLLQMEAAGEKRGFPIIGPMVGRLCEQLARCVGARTVFEMGSGFGYSTAWFARAVGPQGKVVHTEGSAQLQAEARQWLGQAGLLRHVEFRSGDAVALLAKERRNFDVVFLDIDKEQYPAAWPVARDHVRPGGLVITDNALWHGRVAGPGPSRDAATAAVRRYNELATAEPGWLTTVLPLRDGVAVSLRLE